MKKVIRLLFAPLVVFTLVFLIAAPAYAEIVDTPATMFDATDIVVSAIGLLGLVAAAGFGWVAKKYIIPWVRNNHLEKLAEIAVNAAEALFGAGHGNDKWLWAVEYLKKYQINIDFKEIDSAVMAAWNKLNLGQIAAGVKSAEPNIVENPGARG